MTTPEPHASLAATAPNIDQSPASSGQVSSNSWPAGQPTPATVADSTGRDASELGITDTDQPASARVDLVIGLRQRGVPQHPDGPEAAALAEIDRLRPDFDSRVELAHTVIEHTRELRAEIDRLRAEAAMLRARVREWEAVNSDLAERCDSGDIPIRLGERYSQAVLREIDRLRAELEMAEQDRDLARQAAENRQRERDAVRVVIVGAPERRPT